MMRASSQQIDRYSEVVDRHVVVHAGAHGGNDYTLCGAALDGEDGNGQMLRTRRRVTCRECIGIIRYCKSIPNRVLNAPALTSNDR